MSSVIPTDASRRRDHPTGDLPVDQRRSARSGLHLPVVWVAGVFAVGGTAVLSEVTTTGGLPLPVGIVVAAAFTWGLMWLADLVAPGTAGPTRRNRLARVTVLAPLGSALAAAEAPIVHELREGLHISSGPAWLAALVFLAAPFPLAAGMIRPGRARWGWLALTLVVAGVVSLVTWRVWRSDTPFRVTRQLAMAGLPAQDAILTTIPGYRDTGYTDDHGLERTTFGGFHYTPDSGTGPDILIAADELPLTQPSCGPDLVIAVPDRTGPPRTPVTCTTDTNHLRYRTSPDGQQYVRIIDGDVVVRVSSGPTASRTLLRNAALAAHLADDSQLQHLLPPQPHDSHNSWYFFL